MGTPRAISGRWHLLPLALLLGSLAALALTAALFWVSFFQDPRPVSSGDRVTVTSSGLTLLRDAGDTSSADCRLAGPGGNIGIRPAKGNAVMLNTGEFVAVGHTPLRTSPGTYTLECSSGGEGLYAGHRLGFLQALLVGLLSVALFVVAVAAWITVLVLRRRARPARRGPSGPAVPYAGWPPQSAAPPGAPSPPHG